MANDHTKVWYRKQPSGLTNDKLNDGVFVSVCKWMSWRYWSYLCLFIYVYLWTIWACVYKCKCVRRCMKLDLCLGVYRYP